MDNERKMLESLLQTKGHQVAHQILEIWDSSPSLKDSASLEQILSFDDRIKTKSDLHRTLTQAGLVFNSPQYNESYDNFCRSHDLPLV